MSEQFVDIDNLTSEDIDILIEALEALEQRGVSAGMSAGEFFGGLIAADSAEEAREIMQTRNESVKSTVRAKKRRVALLKAAYIQRQIEREAVTFFSPFSQKS